MNWYQHKSTSWLKPATKGNNCGPQALLCSNLAFCHKTGRGYQTIKQNDKRALMMIILTPYIPNFKSLYPLVRSTDSINSNTHTQRKWTLTTPFIYTFASNSKEWSNNESMGSHWKKRRLNWMS